MVFRGAPNKLRTSALTKGSGPPSSVEDATEENVDCVASHAFALAGQNPAAVAHLIAYFRVVESVDSLNQKYVVAGKKDGQGSIQRAAKLAGLRLP